MNGRLRYVLEHGQTRLATTFDVPSLTAHDSDPPLMAGEVRG